MRFFLYQMILVIVSNLKKFLLYAKKDKKSLKVQTNSNCE